jgi:hypothetical protein
VIGLPLVLLSVWTATPVQPRQPAPVAGLRVAVTVAPSQSKSPIDGRVLLLISKDSTAEPRFQMSDGPETQVVFGTDVDGMAPGTDVWIDGKATGYPLTSLDALPRGRYWVQAVLNRYETFHRADGHTVKLPPDMGEGQQWNRKPGNLYSKPAWITLDARLRRITRVVLDQTIPAITPPTDTKWIKHERIRSALLSKFWGRDVYLGVNLLLPAGFDDHPKARYPLVIDHGHFPADLDGFRSVPPDPTLTPDYSARFSLAGYNRIQQEEAYKFYQEWSGPSFPRVLLIQIQHPTPYYDDSYAVNSENNGPYGDAIMQELLPYIEQKYRGLGQGYARFTYGGSTGGWEAMAVQMFYPESFNGAWAACPDPIDFRQNTVMNLYADTNAYFYPGPWKRAPRPAHRDYLGNVSATIPEANQHELAIATRGRSGGQWDIWQAVYSPVGADGYPKPIWDKVTGTIDPAVASYWRDHFDLGHILERDWATLGPKVRGKLHIYVGEADNYYLNDAVYLVEKFLTSASNPTADAEVDYEPRAEHCWNGDHTRSNAYARLRYAQMFIPRIMDQIRRNHPAAVDTTSWRY